MLLLRLSLLLEEAIVLLQYVLPFCRAIGWRNVDVVVAADRFSTRFNLVDGQANDDDDNNDDGGADNAPRRFLDDLQSVASAHRTH